MLCEELLVKIIKSLPTNDKLKLRGVCSHFNSLVIGQIYVKLFKEAVEKGELNAIVKIYDHFHGTPAIQLEMITAQQHRGLFLMVNAFQYASYKGSYKLLQGIYGLLDEE